MCFADIVHQQSRDVQLGRTKVFLRAGQIGILDQRRAEVLDNAAKCIQRRMRTFITHQDFIILKSAAISLQAGCRGQFIFPYAVKTGKVAYIYPPKSCEVGWECTWQQFYYEMLPIFGALLPHFFFIVLAMILFRVASSAPISFDSWDCLKCTKLVGLSLVPKRLQFVGSIVLAGVVVDLFVLLICFIQEGWLRNSYTLTNRHSLVMLLLDQGVRLTHLGRYRMLVGKLNYLIVIGPNIAFAFSMVHCDATIWILKYLKRFSHKGHTARKIYAAKRETAAAISIQKYIRMWLTRHAHLKLYFSAIIIQSHVRGFVTRQRFLHAKEHSAATFVQAYWRMSKVRSSFLRYQTSIVAIQCLWRCRQAKRELRRLKQEANEAGALRLAKNKLEKQMEDLTWRLHLEKKIRVSNEEAKKIEISKLQKMLDALNLELDAAKLAKINECNKNAVLQNQLELSVKEKSALKRELVAVDELRKENALLKVSLDAFERKYKTLELELMDAQKGRDETMEKLREFEQKCSQLEQNEKTLEEKLKSLENENHVLRQKALSTPFKSSRSGFAKSVSEKFSTAITSHTDRKTIFESPTPTKLIAPLTVGLSDSRRSKLTAEKHQDNYEFLSKCIKENLGFKNGKPIAARIIYKCLLHWHSFENERTAIFDSIIEGINEVLKVREDDIILPYWLSNTSALLCLLQRNLRSNGFLTATAQRYPGSSGLTSRTGHFKLHFVLTKLWAAVDENGIER
ncbi:hypothetical protein V8G54_036888 [Vigna mungo]|uniref:Uncharacterized protein n=1 Tax=Vigna mungo TaxID=3915 RepID=A0AAQ3MHK1_VIGMU